MPSDRFLLAQISDPHIVERGRLAYGAVDTASALAAAVRHLNRLDPRPDLVLATGDLVDAGKPAEYDHLRALLAPLEMPVVLLPGNHDDAGLLRDSFPAQPWVSDDDCRLVLDEHPVRLVGLDTSVWGEPWGEVGDEQLAWLDARLSERRRPTIVALHHPPFDTGIEHMDAMGLRDAAALAEVVARHAHVDVVVAGHLHRPIVRRFAGTVAMTVPSVAHQLLLDLRPGSPAAFTFEPPSVALHWWRPEQGVVTHLSVVGGFEVRRYNSVAES